MNVNAVLSNGVPSSRSEPSRNEIENRPADCAGVMRGAQTWLARKYRGPVPSRRKYGVISSGMESSGLLISSFGGKRGNHFVPAFDGRDESVDREGTEVEGGEERPAIGFAELVEETANKSGE